MQSFRAQSQSDVPDHITHEKRRTLSRTEDLAEKKRALPFELMNEGIKLQHKQ